MIGEDMNSSNNACKIFGLLGGVLLAAALLLSLLALNASPVLLGMPEAALECSESLMEAVAQGDFAQAGQLMLGQPELGVDREPADEVGQILWSAFAQSIRYEFTGGCYAADSGIARDVTIETLDISSVTATLRQRSQTLLNQRIAEAKDMKQIYDENGDYREAFVMEVLRDALRQALQEDAVYTRQQVTVKLRHQDGRWWVLPEQPLLSAIFAGMAG